MYPDPGVTVPQLPFSEHPGPLTVQEMLDVVVAGIWIDCPAFSVIADVFEAALTLDPPQPHPLVPSRRSIRLKRNKGNPKARVQDTV
jgi:hypothetical protein